MMKIGVSFCVVAVFGLFLLSPLGKCQSDSGNPLVPTEEEKGSVTVFEKHFWDVVGERKQGNGRIGEAMRTYTNGGGVRFHRFQSRASIITFMNVVQPDGSARGVITNRFFLDDLATTEETEHTAQAAANHLMDELLRLAENSPPIPESIILTETEKAAESVVFLTAIKQLNNFLEHHQLPPQFDDDSPAYVIFVKRSPDKRRAMIVCARTIDLETGANNDRALAEILFENIVGNKEVAAVAGKMVAERFLELLQSYSDQQ